MKACVLLVADAPVNNCLAAIAPPRSRTLLAGALCIVLGTTLSGCKEATRVEGVPPAATKTTHPPVADDGSRYLIVRQGKVGYMDRHGVVRIAPAFSNGRPYSEELAAVMPSEGGRWGFIDTSGRLVIQPQFDDVNDFSQGLAAVKLGERYGYIDKAGTIVIPASYTSANDFDDEGCALVASPSPETEWGSRHWIDRTGKRIEPGPDSTCGVARRFGFLFAYDDKDTVASVTPKYRTTPVKVRRHVIRDRKAKRPLGAFDVFVIETDHDIAVVDRLGRNRDIQIVVCVDAQYEDETYYRLRLTSARCGLLNEEAKETVPATFDGIRYLGQGRAAVAVGPPKLESPDPKRLNPPKYGRAPDVFLTQRNEGLFSRGVAGDGRRWGLVEVPGGKPLGNPIFDTIEPYSEGLAVASFSGKFGYLGFDGKWVIEPKFESAQHFRGALAEVVLSDRTIYIDRTGTEVALADDRPPPGPWLVRQGPEDVAKGEAKKASAVGRVGTGFYVTASGDVVTNAHVVNECSAVENAATGGVAANVVMDKRLDLALVRFSQPPPTFLRVRNGGPELGEQLAVFGFPLDGLLASSGVATFGNVSALSGPGDRTDVFQMSAQVGPGSSGGPVVDGRGAVIGIVVARLDDRKLVAATGAVPQNTNFAVKSPALVTFLSSHGVTPTAPPLWQMSKSQEELSKIVAAATTKLRCIN